MHWNQAVAAIEAIRHAKAWSHYVADLVANIQQSVRAYTGIAKLRFLLYPSKLTTEDADRIRRDASGIIQLTKAFARHEQAN